MVRPGDSGHVERKQGSVCELPRTRWWCRKLFECRKCSTRSWFIRRLRKLVYKFACIESNSTYKSLVRTPEKSTIEKRNLQTAFTERKRSYKTHSRGFACESERNGQLGIFWVLSHHHHNAHKSWSPAKEPTDHANSSPMNSKPTFERAREIHFPLFPECQELSASFFTIAGCRATLEGDSEANNDFFFHLARSFNELSSAAPNCKTIFKNRGTRATLYKQVFKLKLIPFNSRLHPNWHMRMVGLLYCY